MEKAVESVNKYRNTNRHFTVMETLRISENRRNPNIFEWIQHENQKLQDLILLLQEMIDKK